MGLHFLTILLFNTFFLFSHTLHPLSSHFHLFPTNFPLGFNTLLHIFTCFSFFYDTSAAFLHKYPFLSHTLFSFLTHLPLLFNIIFPFLTYFFFLTHFSCFFLTTLFLYSDTTLSSLRHTFPSFLHTLPLSLLPPSYRIWLCPLI